MNTKDKDSKTLPDKLKQFFRMNKGKIFFEIIFNNVILKMCLSLTKR